MFTKYLVQGSRNKDDGEKPFWISFADLMTALMVMFLLVMSVALLAVTNEVSATDQAKAQREKEIDELLNKIEQAAERYPGISIDRNRNVIDFGDRARFDTGSHQLSEPALPLHLRSTVTGIISPRPSSLESSKAAMLNL